MLQKNLLDFKPFFIYLKCADSFPRAEINVLYQETSILKYMNLH